MIYKKLSGLFLFFLFSLVVVGCTNPVDNSPNGQSGGSGKDDPPPPPPSNGISVCYPKGCYATTDQKRISDTTKDYDYPDASEFPRPEQRSQYNPPARFLDMSVDDGNGFIATNFRLLDFVSAAKGRYGIISTSVVKHIQAIRDSLANPVLINSGYRSPGYNRRTDGSAGWSRHMYGDAVDFKVSGLTPSSLQKYCTSQNASFSLVYKTHIHCDWRAEKPDPAFFDLSSSSFVAPMSTEQIRLFIKSASRFDLFENDGKRFITVQIPHDEEEGELVYRWAITLQDGSTVQSLEPIVELPGPGGQSYQIHVTVGEAITFDETIHW